MTEPRLIEWKGLRLRVPIGTSVDVGDSRAEGFPSYLRIPGATIRQTDMPGLFDVELDAAGEARDLTVGQVGHLLGQRGLVL